MHYGNYEFRCRFENEAELPIYKGSTFRGVFGRALKQVVCALKRQECPDCLLKAQCLYPIAFEPKLIADGRLPNKPDPSPPNPYIVRPPLTEKTHYPEGADFDFNLILMGRINSNLPYFVYAVSEMGQIGVGKKLGGDRARFAIDRVLSEGKVIYSGADAKLIKAGTNSALTLQTPKPFSNRKDEITFRFLTPLRLKHDNHLTPELPFHILVRAMLRRCSTLLDRFGDGEPIVDYRGMVERASAVETVKSTLAWDDWRRYSHRQDQAMMMGGLKGQITYAGCIEEFLPLIEFCEKVHLGKQTAFGLGHFSWEMES
jgi:hypothetical protein